MAIAALSGSSFLSTGCRNSPGDIKTGLQAISYTKNDLVKIKWIEGKWKGMYEGTPFYEIYRMVNDSTLEIIGYEWNGKDSSNSSTSFVSWVHGAYYLGNEMNYKVTRITGDEIEMIPHHKASNSVLWEKNKNGWTAILEGPKKKNVYDMVPFDPFQK